MRKNRRDRLRPFLAAASTLPVALTLLSFSSRPHWIFRMWDFPRVQIATVAAASAATYFVRSFRRRPWEVAMLAADAAVIAWQVSKIHTYTPLVRKTVLPATRGSKENQITLLMSNVRMENEDHHRLLAAVRRADPDVVLVVETNRRWMEAIEPLAQKYPYSIRQPQENWYGMVLFSRYELVDSQIDYNVEDDIPSIRTGIRLPSGVEVRMRGLHPRPPEPIRDQPSTPRDAELVLVGRALGENKEIPTIVAGDMNDVAWSPTSELFVRLSGLLDPRVGRGFYNSYNANNPLFRFPLDHVFHSKHFKLVDLQRLPSIGSDHFPILVTLEYDPAAPLEQEESHQKPGDEEEAEERLEREREEES